MKAYEAKINLPLFNDIAVFVMDTAGAGPVQRAELYENCPFLYWQDSAFQEKYGFLYMGELLERYEERFGMAVQDLRAIALALGYTRDLQAKEMFVGSQKEDFLRKIRQAADGDIYLAGALYMLEEGRDNAAERELRLTAAAYAATEDLLFAASLFQDHERAFLHFKPQLIRLLGRERTMPVLGNATALNWLVTWLMPCVKAARGKDMALFRALCALPVSHVKPGSKPHDALLEHGYTPLEIAYLNMMVVLSQTAEGVRDTDPERRLYRRRRPDSRLQGQRPQHRRCRARHREPPLQGSPERGRFQIHRRSAGRGRGLRDGRGLAGRQA